MAGRSRIATIIPVARPVRRTYERECITAAARTAVCSATHKQATYMLRCCCRTPELHNRHCLNFL